MNTVWMRAFCVACILTVAPVHAGDLKDWSKFAKGGHPDYLAQVPSTESDVIWCVWHEGLMHEGLPTDEFRRQCASKHRGAPSRNRVNAASNNEIKSILSTMDQYFGDPANGGYKFLSRELKWVLYHEEQRAKVLELRDAGDFPAIRRLYESHQSHHAHVEFLIYAASNETLSKMIDVM